MISISTILRNGERIIRMVPFVSKSVSVVKELIVPLPIESESNSQVRKLKDVLHDKNADIFNLRQKIKRMKRLLFSNNENIEKLEMTVESCKYQINLLTKALIKEE